MNTPNVKKTIIVSAYPCCGKTYAFENNKDYTILDSDSSKFSWIERKRTQEELNEIKRIWESEDHLLSGEGYINKIKDDIIKVRNPHFIDDYLNHIKENIGKVDFIFVSSHLDVRRALEADGIDYITVYPNQNMKAEWIGRMYLRGSNAAFIKFQSEHWDEFTNSIDKEPHGIAVIRLGSNQYIDLDYIKHVNNLFGKEMNENEGK